MVKKNKYIDNKVLFPLVWSIRNPLYQSFTFFPLFSKGKSPDNTSSHLMLTPLLWKFKDHDADLNLLFPIAWQRRTGIGGNQRVTKVLFPVFWSEKDQKHDNITLFPVIWSRKNPEYHSLTLFPLFSKGQSTDSSSAYTMLTPLFWHFRNHDSNLNLFFPLAWQKKSETGENRKVTSVFFPVFWAKNDKYHHNSVLFPLVWSIKNPHYHSFTFVPLFSAGKSMDSSFNHLVVTPFFWHFKKKEENKNVLFPVWWHFESGKGENKKLTNVVFPFYWAYKNAAHNNKIMFPLCYSIHNSTYHSFTLFPLFSKGHSADSTSKHLAITPLLWHFKNSEGTFNVFFPFGWQKIRNSGNNQSRLIACIPLYWSRKDQFHDNKVVFPLIWSLKGPTYHSFTFLPLFSKGHATDSLSGHLTITPLFWHVRNEKITRNILFPLWWQKTSINGTDKCVTNYIFPLYYSRSDNHYHNKILFPLIWSLQNPHYHSFTFFPLFSNGHSIDNKSSHLMLTPFLWEFEKENSSLAILFPFSWLKKKKTDDGEHLSQVIFPVYWAKIDAYRNSKVFFPLVWNLKNCNHQSFTFFPLYSKGSSGDSMHAHLIISPLFWKTKNHDIERTAFFPLWWVKKSGNGENTRISNYIFPLYQSINAKNQHDKMLFPILWIYNNSYYRSFTFAPVYSKGHSPDSTKNHLMVTPFYWHIKDRSEVKNILFPIWWQHIYGKGEKWCVTNYIFPLYWSEKSNNQHKNILFPLIWNIKKPKYNSFTFAPFYSEGFAPDSSKSHWMVTPLLWHIKNKNEVNNLLFPIWWQKKTGKGEELKVTNYIFPLYWSMKDNTHSKKTFFPLIWRIKNPDYQSFLIFPLFFKGHSPDKLDARLMITPFFWHIKIKNKSRDILFPLWWHSETVLGNNVKKINYIFPLFWTVKDSHRNNKILFPLIWKLKDEEHHSFTVFPLFSVRHKTDNSVGHLIITPLFWKIKNQNLKITTLIPLFYYSADSLKDEKHFNIFYFLARYKSNNDRKTFSLLWPLCESKKDNNYRYFRFAPILWYKKSSESNYFSIQPFYFHSNDSTFESYRILWELFTFKKYDQVKTSRNFLWKALIWNKYNNTYHEFRILYFLFANVDKNGYKEKGIFPFYSSKKESNGNTSFSVFFSFYKSTKRQIPHTSEYYMEDKIFWVIRIRSNYKALKEKGLKFK